MRSHSQIFLGLLFGILYLLDAFLIVSALGNASRVEHIITGTRLSAITGLLTPAPARRNIVPRQDQFCPIAGGIECNTAYCCPPGTFCQPENPKPLSCCSSTIGISCNGGTACCDVVLERCCTTNALGCCLLDDEPPVPSLTTPVPPFPTATQIPRETLTLDYKDMLVVRSTDQNATIRKQAIDSLFENMCLGMPSNPTLGKTTRVLTNSPGMQSLSRQAGCGGVTCSSGQSCDEFPFASTAEAGASAIGNCVVNLGNSIQGGFLGTLLGDIEQGDTYELQLTNVNCGQLLANTTTRLNTAGIRDSVPTITSPPVRQELNARQQVPSGLTTQMLPIKLLEFSPWTEFDIFNHSVYYIGNLGSGQYTVNVQVDDGIVDQFHIVDYQGFSYARLNVLTGIIDPTVSLPFTVSGNAVGVTLMLDFLIDNSVSASMVIRALSPLSSTVSLSTSSLAPTTTHGGGATGQRGVSIPAVVMIALSLVLLNAL